MTLSHKKIAPLLLTSLQLCDHGTYKHVKNVRELEEHKYMYNLKDYLNNKRTHCSSC